MKQIKDRNLKSAQLNSDLLEQSRALETLAFSVIFLAEIGLDIAITSLLVFFIYRGAMKWKIRSLLFLVIISPFYLHWVELPVLLSIVTWSLMIPFGFLFWLRLVQGYGYWLVLNPNPREKTPATSKKNLSQRIKDVEKAIVIMLTITLITALTSGIQNIPQIVQIPLLWIGIAVTLGLSLFDIFADKKNLNDNLRVNLKILLISSYFLMGLACVSLVSYSIAVWRANLLSGLTIASITSIGIFSLTNYVLSKTSQAILVSDGKEEFLKTFIDLSRANRIFGFILILTFSDAPIVIGVFIDQNIGQMIYWTIGFFTFITLWLAYALRDDSRLQIEAGLIDKKKVEDDFRKLG